MWLWPSSYWTGLLKRLRQRFQLEVSRRASFDVAMSGTAGIQDNQCDKPIRIKSNVHKRGKTCNSHWLWVLRLIRLKVYYNPFHPFSSLALHDKQYLEATTWVLEMKLKHYLNLYFIYHCNYFIYISHQVPFSNYVSNVSFPLHL